MGILDTTPALGEIRAKRLGLPFLGEGLGYGLSPIGEALLAGDAVAVASVMAAGADPMEPCFWPTGSGSWRLLRMAANFGDLAVVKALLAGGATDADPEPRWSRNDSALITASGVFHHAGIVKELLRAGARQHIHGALVSASGWGREESLVDLLAAGADPNHDHGPDSWTALMAAASNGHIGCVARLLEAGADMDVLGGTKATMGKAPMEVARGKGHGGLADFMAAWRVAREIEGEAAQSRARPRRSRL